MSLRRGATTEAENNNVDTVAIELTNRWRKKEAARGSEASLSMRQVYTQVSRAVLVVLCFFPKLLDSPGGGYTHDSFYGKSRCSHDIPIRSTRKEEARGQTV